MEIIIVFVAFSLQAPLMFLIDSLQYVIYFIFIRWYVYPYIYISMRVFIGCISANKQNIHVFTSLFYS